MRFSFFLSFRSLFNCNRCTYIRLSPLSLSLLFFLETRGTHVKGKLVGLHICLLWCIVRSLFLLSSSLLSSSLACSLLCNRNTPSAPHSFSLVNCYNCIQPQAYTAFLCITENNLLGNSVDQRERKKGEESKSLLPMLSSHVRDCFSLRL